jgi:preprotein translocase subunit SecG
MGFVIAIHVAVCVVLIIIILIQSGRGGGLVESFSSVESMFGTKTNAFLTRMTSILSILFFITCVSLAFLSARQSRSLMEGVRLKERQQNQTTETKTAPPPTTQETTK